VLDKIQPERQSNITSKASDYHAILHFKILVPKIQPVVFDQNTGDKLQKNIKK
jgi:hypothetical protein